MSPRPKTDSRDRIINAAYDLFYRQGYQATSVDEIIAQSGLSKPTVYSYFPTKEQLCVSYLEVRRQRELGALRTAIRKAPSEEERFLTIIRFVRDNMIASSFRGCGFFNMVSEIPDPENPAVKEARGFVDEFREDIRAVTTDLKNARPEFAEIDVNRITDTYYVILCGAIMASQEYQDRWPLDRAVEDVEQLLQSLPQ
jgi:AcrR family transcriptional regulator